MKHRIVVISILSLACSLSLSGQDYRSLDELNSVKGIKTLQPKSTVWSNPSSYRILWIDENTDLTISGGSSINHRKRAILLTNEQLASIVRDVTDKGQAFIGKVPSYVTFFISSLEKEDTVHEKIEKGLNAHNKELSSNSSISVYEYCHVKQCPDPGLHEIVESIQVSEKGSKYVLIVGMPMNENGNPIPWKLNELDENRTFNESLIELSQSKFDSLFK